MCSIANLVYELPHELPTHLTLLLIWVRFLGVYFEVGRGGKITHCLKLVRVMVET